MRVADETAQYHGRRSHAILDGFRIEDVWSYPAVAGTASDFGRVIRVVAGGDPAHDSTAPTRLLWNVRDRLGRWFDLGSITTTAGPSPDSLASRLPSDLCGSADDVAFAHLPFVPLYRTPDEFAAEIVNRTMHGVMHLAWVPDGGDRFHLQMTVYVKPAGRFGRAYMAFIRPFRYLVVYPALERRLDRRWADESRRAA